MIAVRIEGAYVQPCGILPIAMPTFHLRSLLVYADGILAAKA